MLKKKCAAKGFLLILTALLGITFCNGQGLEKRIGLLILRMDSLDKEKSKTALQIEQLKLEQVRIDLLGSGLPQTVPGVPVTWHSAMALEYAEAFEQARWVAHVITPDVLTGTVFRSNDFRPDTSIATGSAVEADYFLKYLQPDSTYRYDGFGYDRGHLAPSADFRWSAKALSESYLYSNMSPQVAEFNREGWAQTEDRVRGYLYTYSKSKLYVVTGPVLKNDLPRIQRGINKVAIPELYWKVAFDPVQKKGIGFVMPNRKITEPVESFAVTIDSVERLTGYDFFNRFPVDLQAVCENQRILADWFPQIAKGDVEPVSPDELTTGQINTSMAKGWIGDSKEITVVGTVVSGRLSRAGNILLNLDKQFPNQVFTVFIRKEYIPNFSYDAVKELKGKKIAVKGKIVGLDNLPAMFIEDEAQVKIQ